MPDERAGRKLADHRAVRGPDALHEKPRRRHNRYARFPTVGSHFPSTS